jgi:xanthine dehydrogenase YagS FAD-binding subunit
MNNFEYIQPETLKEASQALGNNWQISLPFAGGTDLLGMMKDEIESPNKLVNLKSIADLNNISYVPGKGLTIGALVTISEIAEHPLINEKYSVLAQAAKKVASPQLRNVGTIGGNICQRPRCWYFRGEFHCLRKGGEMCYAVDGRNKFHCVIGGEPCFIVHPSDTAVALTALDAKIVIFSGKKSRSIPIRDFFVLPEVNVERENILKPGEIVTEIQIPDLPANTHSGYLKLKERGAWDFAVVSVAAVVQKNGESFTSGSIALGAVAPIPWLEKEVGAQLAGLNINAENIDQLSKKALNSAEPLKDNAYKVVLAQNMIKKILLKFS